MTKVKEKQNTQMRGQAFRNVCDWCVKLGSGFALGFFLAGTISAWISDIQSRKQIRNKVQQNG